MPLLKTPLGALTRLSWSNPSPVRWISSFTSFYDIDWRSGSINEISITTPFSFPDLSQCSNTLHDTQWIFRSHLVRQWQDSSFSFSVTHSFSENQLPCFSRHSTKFLNLIFMIIKAFHFIASCRWPFKSKRCEKTTRTSYSFSFLESADTSSVLGTFRF